MKKLFIILTLLLVTQLLSAQSFSPEVLCNASGQLSNGTSNIDWTLGETIILTSQSSSHQLNSGFGQPSYIITGLQNNPIDYGIQLFPNPVKETLNILLNVTELPNAKYQLFDMVGKEIFNGSVIGDFTTINCSQLAPSMYWLRISDVANQSLQSFKIVKQ